MSEKQNRMCVRVFPRCKCPDCGIDNYYFPKMGYYRNCKHLLHVAILGRKYKFVFGDN